MISGKYQGEVARQLLLDAIAAGVIFKGLVWYGLAWFDVT